MMGAICRTVNTFSFKVGPEW